MTILTPRFLVTVSVMFLSVMCKEASEKTEEMKSSEEPDFTGILQSDEKRTGYYNFVSENGSDIYINVKFKLKQKRAEISDIDKRKATVNLSAKEPGKDAEEEILKLFCDILNIKREQLSFEEGGTDRERTIKLINPQITRYKILFKIIEAWEIRIPPRTSWKLGIAKLLPKELF